MVHKRLDFWLWQWGRLMSLWVAFALMGQAQAQPTTLLSNSGPEKRFALVVGNAAYSAAPLANPINDVRAMAKALRESGFEVVTAENAGRIQLLRVVREFGEKLAKSGGIGLFYFAGHGLQIKGRNYLVPVDAQVTGEDEAAYDSMDADFVLQKMGEAKNRVNIIILDACRNNPFVKTRSTGGGGLAQMDAPVGAIVAYATAPGSVASDGSGANGLYTQHLVQAIGQKGLRVEEVFKQVRANVRRDSQGKQIPWENTALEGEFFFFPPESVAGVQQVNPHAAPPAGPSVLEAGASEQAVWEAVRNGDAAEVGRFVARYPNGRFAQAARERLAALRAAAMPAPSSGGMPSIKILAAPPPTIVPPPPVASSGGARISLQSLSAITQSNAAASTGSPVAVAPQQVAAMAPPVQATVATASVAQGTVWNYRVAGLSGVGGEQLAQVRVQSVEGGWQRFSDGTEIHEDGRVRAVRFGSYLVRAVSDESFLRLPARAGQNGVNTAQVIDAQGRAANSRVVWRTEAAGDAVKLAATVDGVTFVIRYEAYFSRDQLLPVRYESETRNRLAGGAASITTARLQP